MFNVINDPTVKLAPTYPYIATYDQWFCINVVNWRRLCAPGFNNYNEYTLSEQLKSWLSEFGDKWICKPSQHHIGFYFANRDVALLFKLTWG